MKELEIVRATVEKLSDKIDSHAMIITSTVERVESAHNRIDTVADDVNIERKAKHDLYSKIHTVMGVITGIESAVDKLSVSVDTWATKTEAATKELTRGKIVLSTGISAFKIGLSIIAVMGSAFASFVVFIGGKLLLWW